MILLKETPIILAEILQGNEPRPRIVVHDFALQRLRKIARISCRRSNCNPNRGEQARCYYQHGRFESHVDPPHFERIWKRVTRSEGLLLQNILLRAQNVPLADSLPVLNGAAESFYTNLLRSRQLPSRCDP